MWNDSVSGVGVLDKAVQVLDALGRRAEEPRRARRRPPGCPVRPRTGSPSRWRRTISCGATATAASRSGFGLATLGRAALDSAPLAQLARPALAQLRDETEESVQLYVRDGDHRVCIESLESPHGLRTIVAVGRRCRWTRGSARAGAPRADRDVSGPGGGWSRASRNASRAWRR